MNLATTELWLWVTWRFKELQLNSGFGLHVVSKSYKWTLALGYMMFQRAATELWLRVTCCFKELQLNSGFGLHVVSKSYNWTPALGYMLFQRATLLTLNYDK